MQLWNKQKTSVFANSWRRSRVIFIEKHFKPICSKITSTTHSVTNRKRWFVKWAMWSYSSYAKQFQKCNAQNAFFYWNQGIVYCTCGHLLRDIKSSRHFHQWRLDVLSIPNCVIKKGRPRGARHGKTEAQKEHFLPHNARKRCIKKNFKGIHDRFQRDSVYRDSQLKIGWTEEKCIEMDEFGAERFHPLPILWGVREI